MRRPVARRIGKTGREGKIRDSQQPRQRTCSRLRCWNRPHHDLGGLGHRCRIRLGHPAHNVDRGSWALAIAGFQIAYAHVVEWRRACHSGPAGGDQQLHSCLTDQCRRRWTHGLRRVVCRSCDIWQGSLRLGAIHHLGAVLVGADLVVEHGNLDGAYGAAIHPVGGEEGAPGHVLP